MKRLIVKSLANQIIFMVAMITTLLTCLFIIYYTLHGRNALERYSETSGLSFTQSIAQSSLLGVMAAEPIFLEQTFSIATNNPEVIFVAAYDSEGSIIRQSSKVPIDLIIPSDTFTTMMEIDASMVGKPIELPSETVDDFFSPVRTKIEVEELSEEMLAEPDETTQTTTQAIGLIRVGFSRKLIASTQRTSTIVGLLIGITVLAFGIIITFILGRKITAPIKELETGTKRITDGDLDVSLNIRTDDEVGAVAKAFNAMAKALKETTVSRDYVDNIFGSMNDAMVVVSAERNIDTMNDASEKLLGYSANELKGIAVDSLFMEAGEHPFDVRRWGRMVVKPIANLDAEYRAKDGRGIPVSISSAPMQDRQGKFNGLVLIARDMREINSLLEQLRSHASELERYQSVLLSMLDDNEKARNETESERSKTLAAVNSMSDGLIMFGAPDNRILLINPAANIMLGFETNASVTLNEIRSVLGPTFESFIKGQESMEEGRLVHDITIGTTVPRTIRIEGIPVGQGGQWIGSMLVMRDITRERQLDEAKYELVSNVSHELRTPLAIISNVISNLLVGIGGPLTDKLKSNLETCQSNTQRLAHIIDGLLSTATMDADQVIISRSSVDINALVNDTSAACRKESDEKGLTLSVELPERDLYAYMDSKIVGDVLTNLINNAVRYTPKGGTITVTAKRGAMHIEFAVTDTGIGIPPDEQRSIFEHFHQVGRTYGPGEKGVGLGLSISRMMVQRHNGSIGVTSKSGSGSRFYFIIPDPKGEELISLYLKDCLKSLVDKSRAPRLISIAPKPHDGSGTSVDRGVTIRVEAEIKTILKDLEHIVTTVEGNNEILAVMIPNSEEASDKIVNSFRVLAKELSEELKGLKIVIGSVSCSSAEKGPADYIAAARSSSSEDSI